MDLKSFSLGRQLDCSRFFFIHECILLLLNDPLQGMNVSKSKDRSYLHAVIEASKLNTGGKTNLANRISIYSNDSFQPWQIGNLRGTSMWQSRRLFTDSSGSVAWEPSSLSTMIRQSREMMAELIQSLICRASGDFSCSTLSWYIRASERLRAWTYLWNIYKQIVRT